jgi:DhnA family fructose-bisphosphate aldolase class Ia
MSHLFGDSGRAVIVAMDHSVGLGAVDGFEAPGETLRSVLDGRPDGILAGPHLIRHNEHLLADTGVDPLVSVDFAASSTVPGEDDGMEIQGRLFGVDTVVPKDPVAVKTLLVFGRRDGQLYTENKRYVAETCAQFRDRGIPVIVEPTFWGDLIPAARENEPELVADASRIAWELGADAVKCPYTGDPDTFGVMVERAPVPVLVLGGPATGDTPEVLREAQEAVEAGARGIVYGRKIWRSDDPAAVVSALNGIVHRGRSVAEVWPA